MENYVLYRMILLLGVNMFEKKGILLVNSW